MKEFMDIVKIRHLMCTNYHPICNGLVEPFNVTSKRMVLKLCTGDPGKCNKMIDPLCIISYHEVLNESTRFSPFELMYRRHIRGHLQILQTLWTHDVN